MLHDNTKAQGLLRLLTQGLLAHSEQETVSQLGDRSQYIGMSDIGKGMECLRSAVASKLGMTACPTSDEAVGFSPDEIVRVLGKQVVLQRGHWQESGIQNALSTTGVKLVPQLEINTEHNGVPIKAHLDFTLVWGGDRPAVRILELKSNERIPDSLYVSYEAQLYGQVGLLKACWDQPSFAVTEEHNRIGFAGATFPQAIRWLFGVDLPDSPDSVDIEAWVLSISMSKVKPFGPYLPDESMLAACLQAAEAIWLTKEDVLAGNLVLNDLDFCRGFHPLCDWCDVNEDCPKFQSVDITAHDPTYGAELEELALLKEQKAALIEHIVEAEERIKRTYQSVDTSDWLKTDAYRFRVATVAGRKTLDRNLVADTFTSLIGDELKAQAALEQCDKTGKSFDRLYVGTINKPVKSAA